MYCVLTACLPGLLVFMCGVAVVKNSNHSPTGTWSTLLSRGGQAVWPHRVEGGHGCTGPAFPGGGCRPPALQCHTSSSAPLGFAWASPEMQLEGELGWRPPLSHHHPGSFYIRNPPWSLSLKMEDNASGLRIVVIITFINFISIWRPGPVLGAQSCRWREIKR